MRSKSRPALAAVIIVSWAAVAALIPLTPAAAQDLLWARQPGTSAGDGAESVAVDKAGNAYITGGTDGSLGGPSAGESDYFLAKYDASGTLLWTRQAGTSSDDYASGVAVDTAGNAFITGFTEGSLFGPSAGGSDYFLAKYDASGTLLWTRQAGSLSWDIGLDVAVDRSGNAYISGYTHGSLGGPSAGDNDYFLAKYDASGALLWTRQAGTAAGDSAQGVAVDNAGNAYISGGTRGSLGGRYAGGTDAFLAKYDASGVLLWTRQLGTALFDYSSGVAVDSAGNAYISGETTGSLGGPNAGFSDYFLAKYDASGTLLWTRQSGTTDGDGAEGVAVDDAGNAYITGWTQGSLGGPKLGGREDAFLAKYDASGVLLWTRQAGSSATDHGLDVAVDNAANAYITGYTIGRFGGPQMGEGDAFLAKYGDASCYADCDKSTGIGVLDVFDFLCFQNSFVNSEPYACDCDTSTGAGVCDVFDFLCFQDAFVAGCP